MFSMCSELTPCAPIPVTRIPQFMQPCVYIEINSTILVCSHIHPIQKYLIQALWYNDITTNHIIIWSPKINPYQLKISSFCTPHQFKCFWFTQHLPKFLAFFDTPVTRVPMMRFDKSVINKLPARALPSVYDWGNLNGF